MANESYVYNTEMLEVIGLLEDIVIDEYLVVSLSPPGNMSGIYSSFLNRVKYSYRWFGIRSKSELVEKWNDIRVEMETNDPDFTDTSPSTQVALLTQISQRLKIVTESEVWEDGSWLFECIASTVNIYDHEAYKEEDASVMYDPQISSTLTKDDIIDILESNHWLVVVILLGWISNRCVLQALGRIQNENILG